MIVILASESHFNRLYI